MPEKNLVINNRKITYSGIFDSNALFNVISDALEEKGYEKREKRAEEIVTEEGKNFYLELRPHKVKASYISLMIKIKIHLFDLTQKVQEVEGVKKVYDKGNIEITFDSWILGDWENRWGTKPFYYFMKGFINKWFYKFPTEPGFRGEIVSDTAHIYGRIKGLLASYRRKDLDYVSEDDVKKQVLEEIESARAQVKVGDKDLIDDLV